MARIRTIKPEFWTSEQIVDCSTTARLLFIGLWNFSDDGGVHPDSPRRIKMEVFPGDSFTDEQIKALVDELISAKLLERFSVSGERYLAVTGWRHQKIEKPTYRWPQQSLADKPDDQSASGSGEEDEGSPNPRRLVGEGSPPDVSTSEVPDSSSSSRRAADAAADDSLKRELEQARPIATRILQAWSPEHGLSRISLDDQLWIQKISVLALRFGDDWLTPALEALKQVKPDKPRRFLGKSLNEACKRLGTELDPEVAKIKLGSRKSAA